MINTNTWFPILVVPFLCFINSNFGPAGIAQWLEHNYLISITISTIVQDLLIISFLDIISIQLIFPLSVSISSDSFHTLFPYLPKHSSVQVTTSPFPPLKIMSFLCTALAPNQLSLVFLLTVSLYAGILPDALLFPICELQHILLLSLPFLLPYPSTWQSCPPNQSLVKCQFHHVAFFNSSSDTNVTIPFFEMP